MGRFVKLCRTKGTKGWREVPDDYVPNENEEMTEDYVFSLVE